MRLFRAVTIGWLALAGIGAALPPTGPLPMAKPENETEKPAPPEDAAPPASETPKPQPKPDGDAPAKEPPARKSDDSPLKGTVLTPKEELVIEPEDAGAHAACIAALTALGATLREEKRIDEGEGCGIDKPVVVSAVAGIAVRPEATLTCPAALALARWMTESAVPIARAAFPGQSLQSVENASGYICRLRNNAETGKISEHARGNAIDVAGFTLSDKTRVDIHPRREDGTLSGAFQRAVTASACLYFTTVLDPESDAAHEKHLHLDVLKRDGGYRYCR